MDHQDLTLFFTSILISILITLLLAYFIVRRQSITGTRPLLFVLLVEIIWIMGGLFGVLAESVEERLFWSTVRWILIFTFPALLYEYVNILTRDNLNQRNLVRTILTIIPAVIVVTLLVFPQYNIPLKYFDLLKHENITGQFSNLSLPLWIGLHFAYLASLYFSYVLLKHYNKQSRKTLLVYLTFIPSVLVLLIGSFMGVLQIGAGRMPDFSPIAIGITNLFFAYYLYSNKIIEIVPIARDLILETMQDGVIIVDRKGRLLDINQAAREMTGIGLIKPAGQMLNEIFPEWMAHIDIDQENANYLKQNHDPSTDESSFFDITISNIQEQKGGLSGKLILIRRVTDLTDPIINANRSISLLESAVESRTDELRQTVDQLQAEISDRMKVENELRFSEAKFRTVIEQASEPFILIDEKNNVIESNRAFEKLINRPKEEFLGREVLGAYKDLLPLSERTREKIESFKRILNKIRAGESTQPYNQELDEVIALPDGAQKFIRYSIFRVLTEEGSRVGFIARDITDQRKAEQEAQKTFENLKELTNLATELAEVSSLEDIYTKVADKFREITGAKACIISRFDQASSSLVIESVSTSSNILQKVQTLLQTPIKNMQIKLSEAEKQRILEEFTGHPASLAELSFNAIPQKLGEIISKNLDIENIQALTFQLEKELFGTMAVFYGREVQPPTNEILKTVSYIVSMALRRKIAEHDLIKSEERFRSILENSTDMISVLDDKGNRKYIANAKSFFRVYGFSEDEINNQNVFDILHPDDIQPTRHLLSQMIENQLDYQALEVRGRRKDGKWVYIEVEAQNMLDNPLINGIVLTARDITSRKQSELSLRQSEQKFRKMFEKHQAVMLLISPVTGNIIDANLSASKFYGYSIEELQKLNIRDLDILNEEEIQDLLVKISNGTVSNYVIPQKISTGEIRTVEVNTSIIENQGEEVLFSIINDISSRSEAEVLKEQALLSLRESEEKMQSIFRVAPTGIGVVKDRVLVYVNPKICEMVGYDKDELIGQSARMLYPSQEEFEYVGKEKYRQIAEHDTGQVETIWKKKDGTLINVLLASTPIDLTDLSKGVTFTALDITDRKASEIALAASEEKFRTIFEASEIGISTNDLNGRFLTGNPATLRTLGYTLEEYCKLSIEDISHPEDKEVDLAFQQELISGKRSYYSMDKRNRHKDGHFVWGHLTSVLVRDQEGNPQYCIGMFEDISKRKEAEDSLHTQDKFIRTVIETVPVGLFVTNKEGIINYLNPAGKKIWQGVKYVDASNLSEYKGWRLSDGKRVESLEWGSARAAINGETVLDEEIEIEAFDGTHKIISNSGIPLYDDSGNLNGSVAIVQDITERKEAEKALLETSEEIKTAYNATLQGWSHALELREQETAGHSLRVVNLMVKMARRFGIPEEEIIHIRRGALLHDIGKMGIPDSILLKPGPLSADEWVVMRQHPVYARQLLADIPYLAPAMDIPVYHHERWDGSGYPHGLSGIDIPLAARIFAVIDVWDALGSDRPYRKGWPESEIINYIQENSAKLFDPDVVDKFIQMISTKEGSNDLHDS